MKDVGGPASRKATSSTATKVDNTEPSAPSVKAAEKPASTEKENKVTITEIFEFAGEEVK